MVREPIRQGARIHYPKGMVGALVEKDQDTIMISTNAARYLSGDGIARPFLHVKNLLSNLDEAQFCDAVKIDGNWYDEYLCGAHENDSDKKWYVKFRVIDGEKVFVLSCWHHGEMRARH